jgi:deoxyribodipyrimidine photo-lyase
MRRAIVWFKTNLRLSDNECLQKALAENDEIIPVYCLDENRFKLTDFGFQKTGDFRAKFLLQSLADLDEQLRLLGSGLIVAKGLPEVEICNIALRFNAQKVYAEQEFVFEEFETANRVEQTLKKIDCSLQTTNTRNLINDLDLPFPIAQTPDVFTVYRKLVEEKLIIKPLHVQPKQIKSPSIEPLVLPSLTSLNLKEPVADHRNTINFIGGATQAQQRLQHYFYDTKCLASYKETRNGMVGSDYSTKFSAWLALGCISPREIYHQIKKFEQEFGANDSTYWLFFELLWRDYFALAFKKYGKLFFLKSGIKGNFAPSSPNQNLSLEKWINGKTGVDFIDANMLELKLTGFMSNRGRQNVASYLINDLKIDWRFGASYFEQQLIDYDVCSNWGNWAYLAGVGNDPRTNRYFNIEKQALTYDKYFTYRNLWLQKN